MRGRAFTTGARAAVALVAVHHRQPVRCRVRRGRAEVDLGPRSYAGWQLCLSALSRARGRQLSEDAARGRRSRPPVPQVRPTRRSRLPVAHRPRASRSTQAREHGIEVALLVTTSPRWANGDRSAEWAPTNPQDYADFVTAASRRYPSVRHWMIWGEPNLAVRFKPNAEDDPVSGRTYAPILDAAYAALKAVSPANVVIGGMTWSGGDVKPEPFLRAMQLARWTPAEARLVRAQPVPVSLSGPRASRRLPAAGATSATSRRSSSRSVRSTPRWDYGRSSGCPSSRSSRITLRTPSTSFVSREEQAAWLTAAYDIANRVDSVEGLGWFSLLDQRPESPTAGQLGPDRRQRGAESPPSRPTSKLRVAGSVPLCERPRPGQTEGPWLGAVFECVSGRSARGPSSVRLTDEARAGPAALAARGGCRCHRELPPAAAQGARGTYRIEVDAARGERVTRALLVR